MARDRQAATAIDRVILVTARRFIKTIPFSLVSDRYPAAGKLIGIAQDYTRGICKPEYLLADTQPMTSLVRR